MVHNKDPWKIRVKGRGRKIEKRAAEMGWRLRRREIWSGNMREREKRAGGARGKAVAHFYKLPEMKKSLGKGMSNAIGML